MQSSQQSQVPVDPFRQVSVTVEFVDSAAGSRKTRTAIALACDAAQRGVKTIFAMPTLGLVTEMALFARSRSNSPVFEITSANREASGLIEQEIAQHVRTAHDGHLLFITHEGFFRVVDWPPQAALYELVIDEVPDVILTRKPFLLRYSYGVLTNFLTVRALAATAAERERKTETPEFTERDERVLKQMEFILRPEANASEGERAQAEARARRLREKRDAGQAFEDIDANISTYYQVLEGPENDPVKAQAGLKRRVRGMPYDDIYGYLDPVPRWLLQGNYLFTQRRNWDRMVDWDIDRGNKYQRGMVTITGFRRPDVLRVFSRVTVMSALFHHTMLCAVWQTLGVCFIPSSRIDLHVTTTQLGARRLWIHWLYDQGWSKLTRDRSGGIAKILQLIKDAEVLDPAMPVCVSLNKDDTSDGDVVVTDIFPNAVIMPHSVRGQNKWREHHQLIHAAALNAHSVDIKWIEAALGIDAAAQRIGRTGQEIYQTLMRLSLREPASQNDVRVVVMDKDVAEWLAQWFEPRSQVEICEIDASAVIRRKGRTGRPLIGDRPMTGGERMRRFRQRRQ